MRLRVGHQHWQFWPILARFMYYYSLFWGSGVISTINEHWGSFMSRSSTLAFWRILAHFMDYYSPIWGPKAISIVSQPKGALTCRSSILAVLADSGPFHGLLLSVLGSQSDFRD